MYRKTVAVDKVYNSALGPRKRSHVCRMRQHKDVPGEESTYKAPSRFMFYLGKSNTRKKRKPQTTPKNCNYLSCQYVSAPPHPILHMFTICKASSDERWPQILLLQRTALAPPPLFLLNFLTVLLWNEH